MVNLILPPQELKLLSIAGDHNCAQVDELYAQFGPEFYLHLGAHAA